MQKIALITGITGQDGTILADLLLTKGYIVHGLRLYAAHDDSTNLKSLISHPDFHLHYADMTDAGSLWRLVTQIAPDEIYNLAAQSHVRISFDTPEATADINALGTLRLLEILRGTDLKNKTRFYQASSSEMFGNAPSPQNEDTPFSPCSPYGAAKLYAYWLTRNYRDAYGIHASNGILFNHESPVRGEEFVTRKIARAVARIEAGLQDDLAIGNLEARRDWGHARDYVEGMWLMLQQDTPDDYVLATGQSLTVRNFIEASFACIGIHLRWEGAGLNERGVCRFTGRVLVRVDEQFFRPTELHALIGDASKARAALGWRPVTGFNDLVREMVEAERTYLNNGYAHDDALLAAE